METHETTSQTRFVSARTLADLFEVGEGLIADLARKGRIPFVMLGSRRRFDVGEVRAALLREVTEDREGKR